MSFLLSCPNCGQRDYEEFRYGGEVRAAPANVDDRRDWIDYLYNRANAPGNQREWWYHQFGCRQWFVAERDVRTNQVERTYVGKAASERAGEGGAGEA